MCQGVLQEQWIPQGGSLGALTGPRFNGKPVYQCDGKPPTVDVWCLLVECLRKPIGCDCEQKTFGNLWYALFQPTFVNFVWVIAQIHPMRHNQIDDRVEVAFKHASVHLQQANALIDDRLWGFWGSAGKSGSEIGGEGRGQDWVPRSSAAMRPCSTAS